ncbi:MAG: hypothetical protein CR986_00395 [Ignavibacteriae bacterium]|nr:MAG: hypothetical protein CR986_00395 [Ignavibacteriota bacterium]
MKSIWKTNFKNFEITVENTWFNGERLFINNELKDEKYGTLSSELSCEIIDEENNVHRLKVSLGGFLRVKCSLFINESKIEITQIK